MVHKIELRAHAGAPSSRQDDDRSRALALAYLGFTGQRLADLGNVGLSRQQQCQQQLQESPVTPRDDAPHEDTIVGGLTVADKEDSTFIDDTQLAYNALESQLNTSSLTVPEITPLKRPAPGSDENSPWPDNLEQQSPHVIAKTHNDKHGSPTPLAATSTLLRSAKKPRLQANASKGLIFKPFKLPIQREPVAGDCSASRRRKQDLRTPEPPHQASQDSAVTRSSYLKTPILVTPEHPKHNNSTKAQPNDVRQRASDLPSVPAHIASPSKVADCRERTPRTKPLAPYIPLPEGSTVGLAFIGEARPERQETSQQDQHRQSQISGSGVETTSELPTSYSLSDLTSQSSRARVRQSQRSTSDPGPIGTGSDLGANNEDSARSASQPPRFDAAVSGHTVQPLSEPFANEEAQAVVKRAKPVRALDQAPNEQQKSSSPSPPVTIDFSGLPLSFHPPEPVVSAGPFKTHVTAGLKQIDDNLKLKCLWKPVSVSRDILPLERGFWLLKTSTWPSQLQFDVWRSLERYIASGIVCWGVWCIREYNYQPSAADDARNNLGTVRVYCWGEIVQHLYGLLYVASMGKVRKLGLQWIDAEEKVVVQMRS